MVMEIVLVVLFGVLISVVVLAFMLQRWAPRVWSRFAARHGLQWSASPPTAGVIAGSWQGFPVRIAQESAIGAEMTRGPAVFRVGVIPPLPQELVVTPRGPRYAAYRSGLLRIKTGDAAFDRRLGVYAQDGATIARLLTPEVRQAMLAWRAASREAVLLYRGELVLWHTLPPVRERVLADVLDRMVRLAQPLSAAASAELVREE